MQESYLEEIRLSAEIVQKIKETTPSKVEEEQKVKGGECT